MHISEYEQHLKHQFRKTPKLQKYFERLVCIYSFGDYESISDLFIADDYVIDTVNIEDGDVKFYDSMYKKFFDHKNLFKEINLRLDGFPGKYGDSHQWAHFEDFDDHLTAQIQLAKTKKYANSILRENKHLADDDSFEKFQTLLEMKISKDKVSEQFSKISAWDTSDQLNRSLDEIIDILNQKDINDYIKEVDNLMGATVVSSDDNILIIDIKNYEASQKLGSSSWCISYDETYWDKYIYADGVSDEEHHLKESDNSTFFVFDFNKHPSDLHSKIAFTTLPNSKVIYAHNKNDSDILDDFSEKNNELTNYLNNKIASADNFDITADKFRTMDHLELYDKAEYIELNIANPINYIAKYLEEDFIEDVDEQYQYEDIDYDELIENSYNSMNNVIDKFISTGLYQKLISEGDVKTISTLFKLKNTFDAHVDFNIVRCFENFDVNNIKEEVLKNPSSVLLPMRGITGKKKSVFEHESGISEKFISSLFNWDLSTEDKDTLFEIFMHRDWKSEGEKNFFETILDQEYENISLDIKSKTLKTIQNMPPKNVETFLIKLNQDPLFSLKNIEITFQDVFIMATSESIQSQEFKKHTNIINEIKNNVIERNEHFKGNGLTLYNKVEKNGKGIHSKNEISFLMLNAIADNNIIKKSDIKSWLSNMTHSPFRGVDQIFLKKRGDYNNYLEYFNDTYSPNKNTKKRKIT